MCGGWDEIILTKSVSRCSWSARWDRDAKLMSGKLIKAKARTKGLTLRGNKVEKKVKEKSRERWKRWKRYEIWKYFKKLTKETHHWHLYFRNLSSTEYNLTLRVTRYRSKKLCGCWSGVAILLRVPLNTLVYKCCFVDFKAEWQKVKGSRLKQWN